MDANDFVILFILKYVNSWYNRAFPKSPRSRLIRICYFLQSCLISGNPTESITFLCVLPA